MTLVQLSFEFHLIEAKPENLRPRVGPRQAGRGTGAEWIEMIAPHRNNRLERNKTHDGRPLRRYQRRWLVEGLFAWLQWHRRLLVRWEFYAANFLGFVQLASIVILLKRVLDIQRSGEASGVPLPPPPGRHWELAP